MEDRDLLIKIVEDIAEVKTMAERHDKRLDQLNGKVERVEAFRLKWLGVSKALGVIGVVLGSVWTFLKIKGP